MAGSVPVSWTKSICIPVHKKGSKQKCSNFRGISLIQVVVKVLESILAQRMNNFRERRIREEQCGFRRGRSCIDHIFTVRQTLEVRKAFCVPTLACFLDIKGAFDSVDRKRLWEILLEAGVPVKIVELIKSMYSHQSTVVRAHGGLSEEFCPMTGVWQGAVLSPQLFTWVVDRIVKEAICVSNSFRGVELGDDVCIKTLEYADDLVVFADSSDQLQGFLDCLEVAAGRDGLQFSPQKCAMLVQDVASNVLPVKIANVVIPVVDRFVYLGSMIQAGGKADAEVSRRVGLASSVMRSLKHMWASKTISLKVKGRVYEACVRSVLLYGSETWTLTKAMLNAISVFDSQCLRWISHIRWQDFVSNVEVQERVFGDRSKEVGDITKVVFERELRWLGHVARMEEGRLPLKVLSCKAKGSWRRPVGGSGLHWRKMIKDLTDPLCRDGRGRVSFVQTGERRFNFRPWLNFVGMFAADRSLWRTITRCICQRESMNLIGDVALLRDSVVGLRARSRRR